MAMVRKYRPVVVFDIGSEKAVVAGASEKLTSGATLIPNNISKLSTPSAVSFRGRDRLLGEEALSGIASHTKNSFERAILAFPSASNEGSDTYKVVSHADEHELNAQSVAGFAIGRLHSYYDVSEVGKEHAERLADIRAANALVEKSKKKVVKEGDEGDSKEVEESDETATTRYAFVSLNKGGSAYCDALRQAAYIGGVGHSQKGVELVPHATALLRAFEKKNLGFAEAKVEKKQEEKKEGEETSEKESTGDDEEKGEIVMLVDVGAGQTTAIVFRTSGTHKIEVLAVEESVGTGKADSIMNAALGRHVVEEYQKEAGSISLEGAMVEHVFDTIEKAHPGGETKGLRGNAKAVRKVFTACEKVKKLLSTVPEAAASVENLLGDEGDYTVKMNRSEFVQLGQGHLNTVTAVINRAKAEALKAMGKDSESDALNVSRVEVVGGGVRVPFIQEGVKSATGVDTLGYTLDSTSAVATGACFAIACTLADGDSDIAKYTREIVYVCEAPSTPSTPTSLFDEEKGEKGEKLEAARERESQLRAKDDAKKAFEHALNSYESYIFHLRSETSGKFGSFLPSSDVGPLLTDEEDWLYSEEAEEGGEQGIQQRREGLEQKLKELYPTYFEKVEEERKRKEEEEKKREAEMEKESEGAEEDAEDKDHRKLKTSQRINLAKKNQEEGNELFRGSNHSHAATRYQKALTHLSKCFDLSPDDVKAINAIKAPCHNNLAACYLKLESYDKVIENCDKVLEIDDTLIKAWFRKGQAHFYRKEFDEAVKVLTVAHGMVEEDKAIKKFLDVATKKKAEVKKKEKAMFSKMFS